MIIFGVAGVVRVSLGLYCYYATGTGFAVWIRVYLLIHSQRNGGTQSYVVIEKISNLDS